MQQTSWQAPVHSILPTHGQEHIMQFRFYLRRLVFRQLRQQRSSRYYSLPKLPRPLPASTAWRIAVAARATKLPLFRGLSQQQAVAIFRYSYVSLLFGFHVMYLCISFLALPFRLYLIVSSSESNGNSSSNRQMFKRQGQKKVVTKQASQFRRPEQ